MKKIIIFLVLCLFSSTAVAEVNKNIKYEFFGGEFGIRLPDSFFVIHENITDEELVGTDTNIQDALDFLDSFSTDLWAEFDDGNKSLSIQAFKDSVTGETPFEGLSGAEYFTYFWMQQLESDDENTILFAEPYVTKNYCFGKVAYMFGSDEEPVYCLDYITVFEKDMIRLVFYSYNGQFDIENDYMFDTIASSLFDCNITVSSGI